MPPEGHERLDATVSGRVQGVGFRWFVHEVADGLGLTGWVANEAGGTVRVVAEGAPDALDRLESELRSGPRGAAVADVRVRRDAASGEFDTFGIRSGWHAGD
jgi:acylphosphatase